MTSKTRKNAALFAVALIFVQLLTSSCSTSQIGITPSTTPITANDTYTIIGPTEGSSCGMWFIGIPFAEPEPSAKARDRAIAASGGDAMIEVVQEYNVFNFFFLFVYVWTNCEGTAVKIKHGGR